MRPRWWPPSGRVWLAFGLTVVVGLAIGVAAWRAVVLQQTAQDAREHLTAARSALSDSTIRPGGAADAALPPLGQQQLTAACAEASAASDSLRDVNGQLQAVMPLVGALEALPGLGPRARSQAATLEAGTQLAAAGASLCDGLGPLSTLLGGSSSDAGPQSTREIMLALTNAQPKIVAATQRLQQLQGSLSNIQDNDLEPANRAAVVALRERLPQVVKTMHEAGILLDMMGPQRPRRYLLVSQNPDELRATGGYIGSAGVVEAGGGNIRLVEYGTSRRYDTPIELRAIPPAEFQTYLGQNSWNLAGANWWASFPDVARQLAYFYGLSHPGDALDGVIALDQVGLAHVLDVLGPVDVPDYGERVSAADLQAKLDQHVHAGGSIDENSRKQFTAALSTAVLQGVMTAPRSTLPGLVKAARASLDEQHLLIWVNDPAAAQLLAARHWDGAILPASGDALMLVDTEVVSSKQSQAVAREATYDVTLASGERASARLDVVYTNTARPEQRPNVNFVPEYRTFLRVLVPPGADLVSSTGFDRDVAVTQECGRRVFAGQVTIAEGASTHVTLNYQLPQTITAANYDLLVQQQPGVPPGRVMVGVSTPDAPRARAELANAAGRHGRFQLGTEATTSLQSSPLSEAAGASCGLSVVEAHPISPPVSIAVPAADIDAGIAELGVSADGQMDAPATPYTVGWYRMSSRPGQPGNSVMSGHVDWGKNTAVFWGLRKLQKGEMIDVTSADGAVHRYAVEWNEVFSSDTAPADRLVGPSRDSVLTLITCDGTFDQQTRQYPERRVVRARLVE